MLFQVSALMRFLWHSQNQHGLHSPFVYKLVTKCFYDRSPYPAYQQIKNYRKRLLKNDQEIDVTDFGAGSRVFTSDSRSISRIAKNAGTSLTRAYLLNRLTRYFQVSKALELGTSVGIGAAGICAGNPVQLYTVEGCSQTAEVARVNLERSGLNNVQLINSDFMDALKKLHGETFDLISIDGNHQKTATMEYFSEVLGMVHNDSVIIIDDIHWSPDMETAWKLIQEHPMVRVSIDTFFWGLVFIRKEQVKQHFIIRA